MTVLTPGDRGAEGRGHLVEYTISMGCGQATPKFFLCVGAYACVCVWVEAARVLKECSSSSSSFIIISYHIMQLPSLHTHTHTHIDFFSLLFCLLYPLTQNTNTNSKISTDLIVIVINLYLYTQSLSSYIIQIIVSYIAPRCKN